MDVDQLHEVVTKLTGPITPVGDSRVDANRFRNLELIIDLVDRLLDDITDVSKLSDRQEASIRKMGERAHSFLTEAYDSLLPVVSKKNDWVPGDKSAQLQKTLEEIKNICLNGVPAEGHMSKAEALAHAVTHKANEGLESPY